MNAPPRPRHKPRYAIPRLPAARRFLARKIVLVEQRHGLEIPLCCSGAGLLADPWGGCARLQRMEPAAWREEIRMPERPAELIYALDERPPWPQLLALGFQHVAVICPYLVMVA